jgi:hypothetical protein
MDLHLIKYNAYEKELFFYMSGEIVCWCYANVFVPENIF